MKRRTYKISSALSPAEIRALIEEKVAWENRERPNGEHRERKVKLRWCDVQTFELRVNFYSYTERTYREIGLTHISAGKQKGMGVSLSEIFRGTILPDGMGGSLIEGKFYLSKLGLGILVPTVLLLGCMAHASIREVFRTGEWVGLISFFVLLYLLTVWTKELYRAYWNSETAPVNQAVLQMLEDWIKTE